MNHRRLPLQINITLCEECDGGEPSPGPSAHQFGAGCGWQVSECRGAVGLCGRGLCRPQLAGRRLVPDGPPGEAALGRRLPADLPQLAAGLRLLLVQHRAGVVPDLKPVVHSQPGRARRRDNVLAVRTPREVGGVRRLRFGHL